jgi:hypothetical protein
MHARELENVALDDKLQVVVEPSRAIGGPRAGQYHREPARYDPADVLLARDLGWARVHQQGWIAQENLGEVLTHPSDLPLGEGQDIHAMGTARERLGRRGQRRISRRAGEHEPSRSAVAVELGLDRVQHLRHVLKLVDQHRGLAAHEQRRIGPHSIACAQIVEIDDLPPSCTSQLAQQRGLPHRPRTLQNDHGLVAHTPIHHRTEPALDELAQDRCHTPILGHSPRSEGKILRDLRGILSAIRARMRSPGG